MSDTAQARSGETDDATKSKLRQLSEGDKPAKDLKPLAALLPYILKYPTRLVLTLMFLLVAAVAQLAIPMVARGLVDEGFVEQNLTQVASYGWWILLIAAVSAVSGGARFYFISVIGERVLTDIRTDAFNHLLNLDSTFFDTHRTGELTSRLNGDVATVRSAVGSSATLALRSMVMFSGAVVLMFLTSFELALAVVIGIPLLVFPILYFARRLRKMSRTTQDALADLSAMATEVLSSTKTIKTYVQEQAQSDLFNDRAEDSYKAEVVRLMARSVLIAVVTFIATGAIVLLLWYGASAVFNGSVSVGQLTQFLIYALFASMSLTNMSEIFGSLQTVAGATERLIEILQTPSRMKVADNPTPFPNPALGTVTFSDVGFSYLSRDNEVVLDSVDFDVSKGDTVAIVGPSGSGKSTIFALLQRFYDATSGSIFVDGVNLLDADPAELRRRFAYVEQESTIFAGTVADNIRFGKPEASMAEVKAAADAALVDDFVSQLPGGYDTIVGERGVMLSGGQKQRIAIARALLKDAPILLLDEATSALDAQSEHLVQEALERLMVGRTTLVIAHRLATIRDADRILVLDGGKLIAEGTHEQLIAEGGRYAELAKLQFDAVQH